MLKPKTKELKQKLCRRQKMTDNQVPEWILNLTEQIREWCAVQTGILPNVEKSAKLAEFIARTIEAKRIEVQDD